MAQSRRHRCREVGGGVRYEDWGLPLGGYWGYCKAAAARIRAIAYAAAVRPDQAMVTEHDTELEDWPPAAVDPVRQSIGNLLVAIIESTAEGSPERARAMNEALHAHERIKDAMRDRPTIN
jgi:hypothetical protein